MNLTSLIIGIIITIICTFIHVLCFAKLCNEKLILSRKNIILIFIIGLLAGLNSIFVEAISRAITSLILMFTLYSLIFKKEQISTLFNAIIIFVLGMLFDILVSIAVFVIGIKNVNTFFLDMLYLKAFFSILVSVLIYIICRIPKFNRLIAKCCSRLDKQYNIWVTIAGIVSINFLGVINLLSTNDLSTKYLIIFILIFICALTMILLSLVHKNQITKQENFRLSENNDNYAIVSKEYRVLRHNLINRLRSIETVANKKAKFLLEDLISQYQKESDFIEIIDLVPSGINGIIYQKLYPYADENIDFVINNKVSEKRFQKLTARKYNLLCEIIGIILDNALEALIKCDQKILCIDIDELDKNLTIQIINTFNNSVDIDSLGNENYSTKERESGLGLNYLLKHLKNNLSVKIVNNMFIVNVSI